MANIIDLIPLIHLRDTIQRKRKLMQSIIKNPVAEITLGDLYDMQLDIQRMENKLKLQIKKQRLL